MFESTENTKPLRGEFTMKREDRAVGGFQVLAHDPATGSIKAWTFGGDGDLGEAVWTRTGKGWSAKTTGVTPEGETVTATTLITPLDEGSFTWQSVERTVDGEKQPDVGPVKVVRAGREVKGTPRDRTPSQGRAPIMRRRWIIAAWAALGLIEVGPEASAQFGAGYRRGHAAVGPAGGCRLDGRGEGPSPAPSAAWRRAPRSGTMATPGGATVQYGARRGAVFGPGGGAAAGRAGGVRVSPRAGRRTPALRAARPSARVGGWPPAAPPGRPSAGRSALPAAAPAGRPSGIDPTVRPSRAVGPRSAEVASRCPTVFATGATRASAISDRGPYRGSGRPRLARPSAHAAAFRRLQAEARYELIGQ